MKQYIIGGILETVFYISLRLPVELANDSHNIPFVLLFFGPFLPIAFPFLLGAFGRKKIALGALVMACVTFVFNFLPIGK